MAQTIGTAANAVKVAGANINATIAADSAAILIWANQAEDEVCAAAKYDCVTNYASLTSVGKRILDAIVEAKIAQYLINYQPEAIGTAGAALRLNFLQNIISTNMSKIDNGQIKSYLTIPS